MGRALFSHTTDTPELAVIYDLSSSGVAAGLVYTPKNGAGLAKQEGKEGEKNGSGKKIRKDQNKLQQKKNRPTLLFSTRHTLPFQEEYDPDRLLQMLAKAIKDAGEEVQTEGFSRLQEIDTVRNKKLNVQAVHCYFASSWYVSHTQQVEFVRDKPVEITQDFLKKQVIQSRDLLEDTAVTEYINDVEEELVVLEEDILQTTLNGYPVVNPFGKKAKVIDLATYISLIPRTVTDTVEDAVSSVFHLEDARLHSFTRAAYTVIQETLESSGSFLFLDISGELTEISLVNDGILTESVSFPLGKHFVGRALGKALNVDGESALSQARTFLSGHHENDDVSAVLDEIKKRWTTLWRTAIDEFPEDASIPERVYMIVDSAVAPVFTEFITDLSGDDLPARDAGFNVEQIDANRLREHIRNPEGEDIDVFLGIEALFSRR